MISFRLRFGDDQAVCQISPWPWRVVFATGSCFSSSLNLHLTAGLLQLWLSGLDILDTLETGCNTGIAENGRRMRQHLMGWREMLPFHALHMSGFGPPLDVGRCENLNYFILKMSGYNVFHNNKNGEVQGMSVYLVIKTHMFPIVVLGFDS